MFFRPVESLPGKEQREIKDFRQRLRYRILKIIIKTLKVTVGTVPSLAQTVFK